MTILLLLGGCSVGQAIKEDPAVKYEVSTQATPETKYLEWLQAHPQWWAEFTTYLANNPEFGAELLAILNSDQQFVAAFNTDAQLQDSILTLISDNSVPWPVQPGIALTGAVIRVKHADQYFETPLVDWSFGSNTPTNECRLINGPVEIVFHADDIISFIDTDLEMDWVSDDNIGVTGKYSLDQCIVHLSNVQDRTTVVDLREGVFGIGVTICLTSKVGDVNGDGVVNAVDRSIVEANIGVPVDATTCKYDLDTNGIIDELDVSLTYLKCAPLDVTYRRVYR